MNKNFDDKMTPLYIQIKNFIEEEYINKLEHGDKIPTELELIDIFKVSRITVRKSINELIKEGVLIKRQGKGTFVIRKKIEKKITINSGKNKPESFTSLFSSLGYKVTSKIISINVNSPDKEMKDFLKLDESDKVIVIERIRTVNNIPVYEKNYLSFNKYSFLIEDNFVFNSLYEALNNKNIYPAYVVMWYFEADIARNISKLLSVKYGDPLLIQKVLIGENNDNMIHFTEQYFIANKFKFLFE
ncbi:GntR family transcriptional regulator [Brachyspira pilosicoli]|uniref:GntR family transcriptional regulator n=1 Tax=Brachyspira pilosicoli TaxID=52584 RepID=UPI000C762FF0|nr:GntR family transcriptional regulator [Brachyspira pilosicoli]PLV64392.1 UbiC transcription regulator-associated domain protein [Brachyspira pilosicoli SP16]